MTVSAAGTDTVKGNGIVCGRRASFLLGTAFSYAHLDCFAAGVWSITAESRTPAGQAAA